MRTSEQIAKIFPAFISVQSELKNPEKTKIARVKTKTGSEYSYSYADLSAILDQVRPILSKNKLAILQSHDNSNGKLNVVTRIIHESGEWIEGEMLMPLFESGQMNSAQATGSISTYGRRYHLCAMLGIAGEEDTDTTEIKNGSTKAPVSTQKQSTTQPNKGQILCTMHKVPMYTNKNGKLYHRNAQGDFCNGRGYPDEQVSDEIV